MVSLCIIKYNTIKARTSRACHARNGPSPPFSPPYRGRYLAPARPKAGVPPPRRVLPAVVVGAIVLDYHRPVVPKYIVW